MLALLPHFSTFTTENFQKNLSEKLEQYRASIDALVTAPTFTFETIISPLEAMSNELSQTWSILSHLNAVMNSPSIRDTYNACLPLLSDYETDLGQNQALFTAIQSVQLGADFAGLNAAQKKIIEHQLRDFKLSGIDLPKDQQKIYKELAQELTQLTAKFEQNVLDATQAWVKLIKNQADLSGLPATSMASAKQAAESKNLEGYLLTLEIPCYQAVMTYANSRALRQEMYTAYTTRASDQSIPPNPALDNTSVIQKILEKRLALAKLLNFNSYAEESLATKMVKSTEQVFHFLEELITASLPKARAQFQSLTEFAEKSGHIGPLEAWDVAYFSEKLRQDQFDISQETLRHYFPAPKVIEGLFLIVHRLFNIQIKPVQNADVWHSSVECYALYTESGELQSIFYFDLYARNNKRGGAWMDEYQSRFKKPNGEIQIPIAYVTCNFSEPVGDQPSLLTHDEVVTLFHEFGHALQHMLTKIEDLGVSGINGVPWDAVELASQFLENWAWQPESLALISAHEKTQEPLPESLYQKMWAAKNFQSAMMMMRQLEFSLFDFKLHHEFNPTLPNQVQSVLETVRRAVTVVPVPSFNRFQNSFSHIFAGGYAAGYYSYKWAEVMAEDAFSLFLERGIFDQATSTAFLQTILEKGGSVEPLELFIQFRGRPPQVRALLKSSGIIE